jgi:sporulation protein YunB
MRRFRRRLALARWLRLLVLLLAVSFLVVRLAELLVMEPLSVAAEAEARRRAIRAVDEMWAGSVAQRLGEGEMVRYEKDGQGRIAAYHINTPLVNSVAAEATAVVQREFRKMDGARFGIPLGALMGSRVFSGYGPEIPVRLRPVGTVAVEIKQEFRAEGINQTRHRIWLEATATVQVVLPLVSREAQVSSAMPLAETVIVGPVPQSFYTGTAGGVTIPAR